MSASERPRPRAASLAPGGQFTFCTSGKRLSLCETAHFLCFAVPEMSEGHVPGAGGAQGDLGGAVAADDVVVVAGDVDGRFRFVPDLPASGISSAVPWPLVHQCSPSPSQWTMGLSGEFSQGPSGCFDRAETPIWLVEGPAVPPSAVVISNRGRRSKLQPEFSAAKTADVQSAQKTGAEILHPMYPFGESKCPFYTILFPVNPV